jgi:cytochrome bd-type quinol oxidase subunit 1
MFAPLILGVIAIYMIIGWTILAALDRRVARHRSGAALWIGVLFWPITVVVDLASRGGPNRG